MTAPSHHITRVPQVIDIRRLSARELDPLLLEETTDWRHELDWDFSEFAELVRTFAAARILSGAALLDRGEVAGYGHTCTQDRKGLIADLYVRPRWRNGHAEAALFHALLDRLIRTAGVRRVESQLMLLGPEAVKALRRAPSVRSFARLLMKLDANTPLPPGARRTAHRFRLDPWRTDSWRTDPSTGHLHDAAARVMSAAHSGHIDSQINDCYRTLEGTRRLLDNIVQFPGFCQPASYIAFDIATGSAAGVLLSSFVAGHVAQISELCVAPDAKAAGLGYELLRQAVAALFDAGAKRITLTVTASNEDAVGFYTRCGFRTVRQFYAYVWEEC